MLYSFNCGQSSSNKQLEREHEEVASSTTNGESQGEELKAQLMQRVQPLVDLVKLEAFHGDMTTEV